LVRACDTCAFTTPCSRKLRNDHGHPAPFLVPHQSRSARTHPLRHARPFEWSKATDTGSARWLIAVAALLTIGITLVPLLTSHHVDQDFRAYSGYISTPMYFLLPIVAI
jgi:hypothetical protein